MRKAIKEFDSARGYLHGIKINKVNFDRLKGSANKHLSTINDELNYLITKCPNVTEAIEASMDTDNVSKAERRVKVSKAVLNTLNDLRKELLRKQGIVVNLTVVLNLLVDGIHLLDEANAMKVRLEQPPAGDIPSQGHAMGDIQVGSHTESVDRCSDKEEYSTVSYPS